jgi:hypothetical protein
MALTIDGTVVSWGNTFNGQDVVPTGLHNVTAIGAGGFFSLAVVRQDATPPTTTLGLSPSTPNGRNGWYTSPVNVSISASDADDASATIQTRCLLDPPTVPATFSDLPTGSCAYVGSGATVSSDGMHTIYAASQDAAGNTELVQAASFKLDRTPPAITAATTSLPNANGWYNGDLTVHFTCTDALSGIPSGTCPADQVLTGEGTVVSSSAQRVADAAGNNSAPSNVVSVAIDRTPPVVTVTGVTNNATYILGSVPTPGCSTTDALSGVAVSATLQSAGGTTNGVGQFIASCVGAQDRAGNTANASATYLVNYGFSGLQPPVYSPPSVNLGRIGRSYPVKWQLTTGTGSFITAVSAVASVTVQNTACSAFTSDPTDALAATSTGGTSLRYDSTANQYAYNWATPATSGCYTLFITLDSGQVFPAYFNLS